MRERLRHKAIAEIEAIRVAQRAAAQHALHLANAREREAEAARDRADARTEAAATAWREHLAESSGFAPELAHGLASELIDRAQASSAAIDHARHMSAERVDREDAWRTSDAQLRQAGELASTSRRALARDRDERALGAAADGVTFAWRRR